MYDASIPYEDTIVCCPHCHYCCYFRQFEDIVDSSEIKGWVSEHVTRKYGGHQMTKALEFKIGAEIEEHRQGNEVGIGRLYLFASYMNRQYSGPDNQRRELQNQAAIHFQAALSKNQSKGPQTVLITYLTAEMLRRQGKFSQALIWYENALQAHSLYQSSSDRDKAQQEVAPYYYPFRVRLWYDSRPDLFIDFVNEMQDLARAKDSNNRI